ncbi:MAG: hypothetical protein ABIV06_13825, partial [Thermoanaerobaculia bacterium]
MSSVAAILAFGGALFCSFAGWGRIAAWLLRVTVAWSPRGPLSSLGLAAVLAIFAALNAAHALVPAAYALLFGIGLAGFAVGVPRWVAAARREGVPFVRRSGLVLLALVLALPAMTSSLDSPGYNRHDDAHAYMLAVKRVLDTGTIGSDPFNFRLTAAGAGATATLQAPAVALFGWRAIWVVDQGVGMLLLLAALFHFSGRRQVRWPMVVAMLVGFFGLCVRDIANVTSFYLTLALLLALSELLAERDDRSCGTGIVIGLMLAALAAMKYTPLPLALLLVAATLIRHRPWDWRERAKQATSILLACGLPLLLWYAPHFGRAAMLLPLEHGSGPDQVSAGYLIWWTFTAPDLLMTLGPWAALLVLGLLAIVALRGREERLEALALVGVVAAGCLATTWLTGGVSSTRFNRPLVLFACLVAGVLFGGHGFAYRRQRLLALLAVIGAFALCRNVDTPLIPWHDWSRAGAALSNPLPRTPPAAQLDAARRLQEAMPPGSSALVWTDRPFLLDFARDRLFVVDYPFAAGPRPGLWRCRDVICQSDALREKAVR